MSINPWSNSIDIFIEKVKAQNDIAFLKGTYKKGEKPPEATWESKAWQYIDSNTGKKANFFFTDPKEMKVTRFMNVEGQELLPVQPQFLLRAYTLKVLGEGISLGKMQNKVASVRQFIAKTTFLELPNNSEIESFLGDKEFSYYQLINQFIRWLKEHELIPQSIKELGTDGTKRLGDARLAARKNKLPEEKTILALGAIQYEVISWDRSKWKIHPLDSQRDAFICSMVTLALASPNRVAAEQTVLNQSQLKTIIREVNGVEKTVHYLDWKGSKGFDDNKNHILSDMVPSVKHVLDYLNAVTAVNRVIVRFYKKPESSLQMILGDYQIQIDKLKLSNQELSKPTNLFSLGYYLGFYDNSERQDVVLSSASKGAKRINLRGVKERYLKPISQLCLDDHVVLTGESVKNLFVNRGYDFLVRMGLDFSDTPTISELQSKWISYLKKQFPEFPRLRNRTEGGFCDSEYRLFALNGCQTRNKGSYAGCRSPYGIVSPNSLTSTLSKELNDKLRHHDIFTRHGFSEDFFISPHQFRHFLNDAADKRGLPRTIINMWSGRKDPTQIVHYVHTSDDDRSNLVSDILYNEDKENIEGAKKSIRLIARQDHQLATSDLNAASVTSTGLCTQNLTVSPCEFLNDFSAQCFGCAKSCHIAHDDESISLLSEDLSAQKARLVKVVGMPTFDKSEAMKSWYKIHLFNTEKLQQLIEIMTDDKVKKGSLIRLLSAENQFRISDLEQKTVEHRKLMLPDLNETFTKLLIDKTNNENDNEGLLSLLGDI